MAKGGLLVMGGLAMDRVRGMYRVYTYIVYIYIRGITSSERGFNPLSLVYKTSAWANKLSKHFCRGFNSDCQAEKLKLWFNYRSGVRLVGFL